MNNLVKIFNSFSTIQKKLFTPGPLLVSARVKESLNYDYGSRDPEFLTIIKKIRSQLLQIGEVTPKDYTAILMQGSGTYGVESVMHTAISKTNQKVLVIENGAYGVRMSQILDKLSIKHMKLSYEDNQPAKVNDVLSVLKNNNDITHISMVHSETTSGLLNPVNLIAPLIKKQYPQTTFILDAVSSFGAVKIPVKDWKVDYLISTSNKNLQGIPGFSFILANIDKLKKCKGNSRSLALDAYEQWKGFEENNQQFRFTPPTHAIKGFYTALEEFFERGGVEARNKRYSENQKYITVELEKLGFKLYIDKRIQGPIITTFLQPKHKNWSFKEFYDYLSERNHIIYPGKKTKLSTFRIGSIGELYLEDMKSLVEQIKSYLNDKNISIPVTYN